MMWAINVKVHERSWQSGERINDNCGAKERRINKMFVLVFLEKVVCMMVQESFTFLASVEGCDDSVAALLVEIYSLP